MALLRVRDGQIQIALPWPYTFAQATKPDGFAGGEIWWKSNFYGFQLTGKGLAYLQANTSARCQIGRGQFEMLFFVNLFTQPPLDHAGHATTHVLVPLGCAPGNIFFVQSDVAFFSGRLFRLLGL